MQLNQFNLYSMQIGQVNIVDKVDQLIRGIDTINEYNLVKDYIQNRFGEFEGWKQFDYPEEHKQIAITIDEKEITFCVAKDYQQYYGTSWKLT
ncbi:hypothetical protein IKQ21_04805 [bacterium]|nr:hypothetical protein [bacterium]